MKTLGIIIRRITTVLLVITILGISGYLAYTYFAEKNEPPVVQIAEPEIPPHTVPTLHGEEFPVGQFGPFEDRLAFKSGTMTLSIPKLNYKGEVLSIDIESSTKEGKDDGLTEDEIAYKQAVEMDTMLDNGVALFNQSQLPTENNANVSIAGHRDFKGMEFYHIDTLEEGDRIFLEYENKQYVYEYQRTFITTPTDWDPIATTKYSQITLQSCDPIFAPNADYDRIFAVGILVDVFSLDSEEGIVEETNDPVSPRESVVPNGESPPNFQLPTSPVDSDNN